MNREERQGREDVLGALGELSGSKILSEKPNLTDFVARIEDGHPEQRRRRQMTQVEVAHMLRSSQSRVAKMEAGDPTVSLDLLIRSLFALGASRQDLIEALQRP